MKLLTGILSLILVSLSFNCKNNPTTPDTPKDTPPVIQSFTATPPSVEMGQNVKSSFTVTDDQGLDSLVLKATDNPQHSYISNRQKLVSDSAVFSFSTPGTKTLTLTAYADGKTDVKSVIVGVNQNIPPVVDVTSLNGVEGQRGSLPLASFAHDPEGKPVSVSVDQCDPNVVVSLTGSAINYVGANEDVNGSHDVTFSLDDGVNVVKKVVPVVLAARDVITGTAHDGKIGMPVETSQPGMILRPPFNLSKSYLKIDKKLISMNDQAFFKSPKLVPGAYTLEVALVNTSNDSSYVATYSLPAGDQTFNPIVATNTGTGRSLATMNSFSYIVDFKQGAIDGFAADNMLKSIDWTHAKDYTIWISRKDTMTDYEDFKTFTTEEQDEIEQTIRNGIYQYLPDSLQPKIYKAALNEALPLKPGTFNETDKTILVLKRTSGQPGTIETSI